MKKKRKTKGLFSPALVVYILSLAALLAFIFYIVPKVERYDQMIEEKAEEDTADDVDPTVAFFYGEDTGTNELKTPIIENFNVIVSGKVYLQWQEVEGAQVYRVFRRTGTNGTWKVLADTVETIYIDRTVEVGKRYSYAVRCVDQDGLSYISGYLVKGSIVVRSTPVLKSAVRSAEGVTVTWIKVSNAKRYRVFRKTEDGNWVKVGECKKTTFLDETAKPDKKYYYTVRVINLEGDMTLSGYNSAGIEVTDQE